MEDWIKLPDGGSLYELPEDAVLELMFTTGEMRLCEKGWAVAALFLQPTPDFIWPHMKPQKTHLPYPSFVTLQQDGITMNSMFPQLE